MIYIEHPGIIYDIISFGTIYFNKQSFITKFNAQQYGIKESFSYFEEVKNRCIVLPTCIYPFFYYDSNIPCFLTNFFFKYINFYTDTIESFIDIIKDKNILKQEIFYHLFETLPQEQISKIVNDKDEILIDKVLHDQPWPAELKHEILFMIFKFDFVSESLINTLNEISVHIRAIHEKYKNEIEKSVKNTFTKEYLNLYYEMYTINEEQSKECYFSTCFINQYIITSKGDKDNKGVFLFGLKYKDVLKSKFTEENISLENILVALGEPIRFRIIKSLIDHGKLTASQISRILNISVSTAGRGIDKLADGKLIKEDRRDGRNIYFAINKKCMSAFEKLINNFITDCKN